MSKKRCNEIEQAIFPDKTFHFLSSWNKCSEPSSELHSHLKEIEIHYILKGSGTYLIDNKIYDVHEKDILIIHRNELHRIVSIDQKNRLYKITFMFSNKILENYGNLASHKTDNLFKCDPKLPHLLQFKDGIVVEIDCLMRSIQDDFKERMASWKESIVVQLMRLCILIQRYSVYGLKKNVKLIHEKDIQDILGYVDKNLTEVLNVNEIAAKIGLTPNYLSFKFKNIVGMNLKEYIIVKRINEAKRMLEFRPLDKVSSVALEVGFAELSHFNHTFKKLTGFTPSQYRNMIKS